MSLALVTATLFVSSSLLADAAILVALPSELDGMRKEIRIGGQSVDPTGHKVSIG